MAAYRADSQPRLIVLSEFAFIIFIHFWHVLFLPSCKKLEIKTVRVD